MKPLTILSFGAGAIGAYIGGSLALAGHKVVFLEQPGVVDLLRRTGLSLDLGIDPRRGAQGKLTVGPPAVEFTDSLAQAFAQTRFDLILFALKSFDTPTALAALKPIYQSAAYQPPVLCLQNGVDNEPAIATALGADKVITGTVTHSVGRLGPGNIVLEKLRGVGVAENPALRDREFTRQLAGILEAAYLNGRYYPKAVDMKWSKMLTNLTGGAASAILDMTVAEIYAHPGLYEMEIRAMRETLAVMKAQGIGVVDVPKTPVRLLTWATRLPGFIARPLMVKFVGGGRGGKMPSFHIDLRNGRRPSEVDYYNGAVVRAGKKVGIPTPVNQLLNQTLLDLTAGKIPLDEYSHQPEKFLAKLA